MLVVRELQFENAEEITRLYIKNRAYLQPFEPVRDDLYYTVGCHEEMIGATLDDPHNYLMGIFLAGRLIGRISLTAIARAFFQNGRLGYWLDQEQQGRGYMGEAVGQTVRFAFDTLKLHRLEANVMPHNAGSLRVLEKNGFERIGLARKYLQINGVWQDHYLHQLLNPSYGSQR
ncbi:GNAT family N-acetyltransferase [Acetonema longum]|uniref:Ribosomal-protein-alanine N-acetyltransferase n=1 Tax=Acetonema longum DSM 6540 TaxID=1009370 RepID=F7NEZ0_9FIRM|nr:GNAT family protein [Acetonema longum]EGO65551.1 ribosomal-protein-alanine N-acetyltransferase [Acetonema longum DSM 6540]